MYKIVNNLAPSPLKEFVFSCTENIRQTRASSRGDCATNFRVTDFGRSAFSVNHWNFSELLIAGIIYQLILDSVPP